MRPRLPIRARVPLCAVALVWLDAAGRPAVAGQFFRFDVRGTRLKRHALHALHSLVRGGVEAKFNDKLAWNPDVPGIEWKSFAAPPAVAATQKERLLQIRQLARYSGSR